ncbi:MAG: hypothetical protein Q8O67_29835 [Deltaproteobacteria bacterium]|nr:hypothetical protein [Deltaproteobacteria bacterium]
MSLLARLHPIAFVVVAVAACDNPGGAADCSADADCGAARVCAAGTCVECGGNDDCAADFFCCQGACLGSAEIETHCGCGPALSANAGATCTPGEISNALCLVGDAVAVAANVAQGQCGCACSPAEGGPICGAPAAGGEPICSCAENADCRQASVDAEAHLHRVADTCTPDSSCVCFSLGTADACDPDGALPDCATSGGCLSLVDDAANCGKPARSCTTAETGLLDTGTCLNGGCTCDNPTDCQADGLNVNNCAFPGGAGAQALQCLCDDFTVAATGAKSACPMELVCVAGGCQLDGQVFATEEALRGALGLP